MGAKIGKSTTEFQTGFIAHLEHIGQASEQLLKEHTVSHADVVAVIAFVTKEAGVVLPFDSKVSDLEMKLAVMQRHC